MHTVVGSTDTNGMAEDGSALALARAQVAAVRDDPGERLVGAIVPAVNASSEAAITTAAKRLYGRVQG